MKNYRALICFFLVLLLNVGCKKEKDAEPPTKEDMLTAKNWKLTAATGVPTGTSVNFDLYNLLIACQQDNFLKFNKGGEVVFNEGATKCTPTSPQTISGTWSLNATNDVLTVNGSILSAYGLTNPAARNLTVLTLDNQTLKVTLVDAIQTAFFPQPVAATIELTFTAQ